MGSNVCSVAVFDPCESVMHVVHVHYHLVKLRLRVARFFFFCTLLALVTLHSHFFIRVCVVSLLSTVHSSSSEHHAAEFDIAEAFYAGDTSKLMVLKNKAPVWNPVIGAYTLDFQTHVKLPSKKNFQLVDASDASESLRLMFGKIERDVFHLDFNSPITPLQAFAIALSSLDRKRLVT